MENEDKRHTSTRISTPLVLIDILKKPYNEIVRMTLIIVGFVLPAVFHARKMTLSYRMEEEGNQKFILN